mgnify:FL=1
MEKDNKETTYKKLWEDELKAHKWTIKKNLELKSSIEKLIQINDKLITLNTTLTKDREILLIEVGRLNNIIKEKEQND